MSFGGDGFHLEVFFGWLFGLGFCFSFFFFYLEGKISGFGIPILEKYFLPCVFKFFGQIQITGSFILFCGYKESICSVCHFNQGIFFAVIQADCCLSSI